MQVCERRCHEQRIGRVPRHAAHSLRVLKNVNPFDVCREILCIKKYKSCLVFLLLVNK